MCGAYGAYCDSIQEAVDNGDPSPQHPHSLSGNQGFTMQEKWHVPSDLCLDLLRAMVRSRDEDTPPASWYLSLFAGAGWCYHTLK